MGVDAIDCDVLITGADGFIGSHYLECALQDGLKIVAVSRTNKEFGARKTSENGNLYPYTGFDLTDEDSIAMLFSKIKPKAVVHAAALSSGGGAQGSNLISGDVASTFKLMECSAKADVARFVLLGSAQVYGNNTLAHSESEPLAPSNPYGLAKAMCVEVADYFRRLSSMNVIEARLFNVYGPRDKPPRLIPYLLQSMKENSPIELSAAEQERDFIYIDDVIKIIAAAVGGNIPYDCINAGSGKAVSVRTMVERIHQNMRSKSEIRFGVKATKQGEGKLLKADVTRLSELGLIPKTDLSMGISKLINATTMGSTDR